MISEFQRREEFHDRADAPPLPPPSATTSSSSRSETEGNCIAMSTPNPIQMGKTKIHVLPLVQSGLNPGKKWREWTARRTKAKTRSESPSQFSPRPSMPVLSGLSPPPIRLPVHRAIPNLRHVLQRNHPLPRASRRFRYPTTAAVRLKASRWGGITFAYIRVDWGTCGNRGRDVDATIELSAIAQPRRYHGGGAGSGDDVPAWSRR
mmetsp:Transcript_11376/g.33492  ORF Transcript_11376/g.33492 Transcript_11376/m.33492 type:complete len:206 (-) Transcript_11376:352-969(-)